MAKGTLVVVGAGIQLGHITMQALSHIKESDKVLYLVTDPVTSGWILDNNKTAESLDGFYSVEKDRLTTYMEMVDCIMGYVRQGLHVCAVFYGHPGVFVLPSHEAVKKARSEGFHAEMLPGISAEDCLFSDLNIDPASCGCQSFEATDLLVHGRQIDSKSHLIVWQIGVIGEIGYKEKYNLANLLLLEERLSEIYGPDHEVTVYEASRYVVCDPLIKKVPLCRLKELEVSPISTLYVPPTPRQTPDLAVAERLGIPEYYIARKAGVLFAN